MQDFLLCFTGCILGTAIVLFWRADVISDRVQEQAIERGYALHCPHDGQFAWVGECEQKGEE